MKHTYYNYVLSPNTEFNFSLIKVIEINPKLANTY